MIKALVVAIMMATLTMASPVSASDRMEKGQGERKQIHKENIRETMRMMKEVMVILRDLNHYPSPSQKKRLDDMIKKTEQMINETEKY